VEKGKRCFSRGKKKSGREGIDDQWENEQQHREEKTCEGEIQREEYTGEHTQKTTQKKGGGLVKKVKKKRRRVYQKQTICAPRKQIRGGV